MNQVYSFLLQVYLWFSLLIKNLKNRWLPLPEKPHQPTILDATEQYIVSKKKGFSKSYEQKENLYNTNMDPILYDKKELAKIFLEKDNEIEKIWKTRILFETTPRGNIVMLYDPYKMGFSYYSDAYSLPYSLLNAVAMKYVIVFSCRDFFIDDQITPEGSPSPMIEDEAKEKGEKKEKQNEFLKGLENAPFAKLKTYKKEVKQDKETTEKTVKGKKKEYNRNKFICLGKMMNFKFIQKPDKKSPLNGFSSKLLDNLSSETALQKQVLSYKDFKKLSTQT